MKGDKIYQKALKLAYAEPEKLEEQYELLQKAMKLGNADAMFAIASWCFFGKHVAKDAKKAIKLLKLAAAQNHMEACLHLGICYEKGEGVKKDMDKAFEYYVRGALAGSEDSMEEVGRFYWHGLGNVKRNRKLARIWYEFGGVKV